MSTLMFLRMERPSISDERLVNETHALKPQFEREQISRNLRIFNIMRNFLAQKADTIRHS